MRGSYLIGIGEAGCIGCFLGRRGGTPREHQEVIASLAHLSREDRTKALNIPSVSSQSLPQTLEAVGGIIPTLPLFTDEEKIAILKEVRDFQQDGIKLGNRYSQAQLVTPDEIALKPPLLPTITMGGPVYPVRNLRP